MCNCNWPTVIDIFTITSLFCIMYVHYIFLTLHAISFNLTITVTPTTSLTPYVGYYAIEG